VQLDGKAGDAVVRVFLVDSLELFNRLLVSLSLFR